MHSISIYFAHCQAKCIKIVVKFDLFERGVPACAGCHGPAGGGIPSQYPALAGQYAEYTELQLKNFRSEERSNDAENTMRAIADKLSDKQIKALGDYIAGLR